MLIDSFGRVHDSLRISVTDRCNIRCFYCMPNENVTFLPKSELLTFEEISKFAELATQLGICAAGATSRGAFPGRLDAIERQSR
jgi:cyclic pyranopterin phosphate synthase